MERCPGAIRSYRRVRGMPMICYRDMMFCTYYTSCAHGNTCNRALTPEVIKRADEWWNGGDDDEEDDEDMGEVPIDKFPEKPECFVDISEEGMISP